MESSDDHRKKQQEFWMALINKYEKRNAALEQQIQSLQTDLQHQDRTPKKEPLLSRRESTCSCSPCMARNPEELDEKSTFSLSSTDLMCMSQIKELVDREKEAKLKLARLQQQAFIADAETFEECRCNAIAGINSSLLQENSRLTNELKNLKSEMKQCIEKIKGPITRQIEKEKSKNKCLENEIAKIRKNTEDMQHNIASETDELKEKLNKIHQELTLISAVNNKLEDELHSQNCKCKELEEALVRQKLAEAEILKALKSAQQDSEDESAPPCGPPPPNPCNCPCLQGFRGAGGDDPKKRLSLTSEKCKRPPCAEEVKKPSDGDKVSKAVDGEKPEYESCKCQTQKDKDSSKVQAKPELADVAVAAKSENAETPTSTDEYAVENTTATDENQMEETATETAIETTEGGTGTAAADT